MAVIRRGDTNCVSGFAPSGRQPFSLHRLSGVRELRKRVRPFRAGSFSLRFSGGFAVCGRRERCGTRRGGKKGRHLRFLPSLNTRFPCWDSLGADGRLRKQEKDAAVGLLLRVFLHLFAVHRHCSATHTVYSTQAQQTELRNSFARCCGRHLRIIIDVRLYLVAPYGINRANDIRNNT